VRSKRLRTLRLPPKVDAARRLRCCDINAINQLLKWVLSITKPRHAAMEMSCPAGNASFPAIYESGRRMKRIGGLMDWWIGGLVDWWIGGLVD